MPDVSTIWEFIKANSEVIATLLALAGAVYAVIRVIFGSIAQFRSWLRNIWDRLKGRPTVPCETLRIVPQPESFYCNSAMWHNHPATSLSGTWYVTNITDRPVSLVSACITSPRKARIFVDRMQEYVLEPHVPQSIRIQFYPYPAVHQDKKPFKATVVFIDQYDNRYVLKNMLFKPPPHILFRPK